MISWGKHPPPPTSEDQGPQLVSRISSTLPSGRPGPATAPKRPPQAHTARHEHLTQQYGRHREKAQAPGGDTEALRATQAGSSCPHTWPRLRAVPRARSAGTTGDGPRMGGDTAPRAGERPGPRRARGHHWCGLGGWGGGESARGRPAPPPTFSPETRQAPARGLKRANLGKTWLHRWGFQQRNDKCLGQNSNHVADHLPGQD